MQKSTTDIIQQLQNVLDLMGDSSPKSYMIGSTTITSLLSEAIVELGRLRECRHLIRMTPHEMLVEALPYLDCLYVGQQVNDHQLLGRLRHQIQDYIKESLNPAGATQVIR